MKKIKFPSPYGVTVIKSYKILNEQFLNYLFPSPYGVTVIKSFKMKEIKFVFKVGFRPLTG